MDAQELASAPVRSLRERKKTAKQTRILDAAARLFAEKGYAAVTTSEIAAAADVGVGTLFRYAGSKAELLVSVMNDRLAEGIEAGLAEAKGGRTITESILAILRPLSEESMTHPENMIAYEREALFGSAEHRDSATASVSRVEEAILEVLQLPRERRLRQVKLLCRPRDIAMARDGQKILEDAQFHNDFSPLKQIKYPRSHL